MMTFFGRQVDLGGTRFIVMWEWSRWGSGGRRWCVGECGWEEVGVDVDVDDNLRSGDVGVKRPVPGLARCGCK